jgi:glycosyltransferase involved in cell wall biosynthesis
MHDTIFFSVIIPTYNRSAFLADAIDSALKQTYQEFEIIIVDDGSTDTTRQLVEERYSSNEKVKYVYQQNSERAAARNHGARIAKGDYICFFDSDDKLYEHHLETALDFIKSKDRPEIIHLNYDIRNSQSFVIGSGRIMTGTANKEMIVGNFLSCNGVFIRSDISKKNSFNENRKLSAMEDWELWLRLAAQYPIHCCNTITSTIVDHEHRSVLETKKEKLIERVETLMKLVLNNSLVMNYYKKKIPAFISSCHTYVSLHLALTKKHRADTAKYLWMGIRQDPSFVFNRRFLAILKHFI